MSLIQKAALGVARPENLEPNAAAFPCVRRRIKHFDGVTPRNESIARRCRDGERDPALR